MRTIQVHFGPGNTRPEREASQPGCIMNANLLVHILPVFFDRLDRAMDGSRDPTVVVSGRYQPKHLELALSQMRNSQDRFAVFKRVARR